MEVDTAKDAAKEVEYMNVEVDALIAAKEMDIKTKESIARTLLGANHGNIGSTPYTRGTRHIGNMCVSVSRLNPVHTGNTRG